ncbi:MAG: orotidine 5'-phosphate decarboxylase / HUMPS family protein [Bacillota bacterium]
MKKIILPLDGFISANHLTQYLALLMTDPQFKDLLAYVKVNDAVHDLMFGGPQVAINIKEILENANLDAGIFLDLKIGDVSATVINTIRKYESAAPFILTVNSACSIETLLKLRREFPGIELAMFAVPTDMAIEECRQRHGMFPAHKILVEYTNMQSLYEGKRQTLDADTAFDYIVCSPLELKFLKANLPGVKFIVPGIRDEWMLNPNDHQRRTTGVYQAISDGADLVVMGAQLTKGNLKDGTSPEESRRLTIQELNKVWDVSDPLSVLKQCGGYYRMPEEGPLVAYAGTYDYNGEKRNYVGKEYFNFAQAEQDPKALQYFAEQLTPYLANVDVLLGAPMGGIKLATILGSVSGLRSIFAEKRVISLASEGRKEESKLVIDRHIIKPGDRVAIVEDVCNNFSTTEKLKQLIEEKGGVLDTIVCAFNRSGMSVWIGGDVPVFSAGYIPTAQYKQEDPEVAGLVKAGAVCWKPKDNWETLTLAMNGVKEKA